MYWKVMTHLWSYLPIGQEVSYTRSIFGCLLILSLVAVCIGHFSKRRRLFRLGVGFGLLMLIFWGYLYVTRSAWLRIAGQSVVPAPTFNKIVWTTRAPGLETADLDLRVKDELVDHVVFVRLDPHRYRFSVHWDATGARTAEEWQRKLGAAVVVNGSYFAQTEAPLTPLRIKGKPVGPLDYQSEHGAFVTDGNHVDVIDLRHQDLFKAISLYGVALFTGLSSREFFAM